MAASYLPEHDYASIVLLGSFSPKIFQPAWFAAQELITGGDSQDAEIQVITNEVCVFETSWFRLEVLPERWALTSRATPVVESLRDLVVGTFERLPHERVEKLGANATAHYSFPDREKYTELGHRLAPKDVFWEPVVKGPALLSLTIQGDRPDDYRGHVRVRVEPSALVNPGVFIEINDEFDEKVGDSSGWAVKVLRSEWDNHRERVAKIRSHFLTKANDAT